MRGSSDPLARTSYWNDVLDSVAAHTAEIDHRGWDDDDDSSSSDDDSDDGSGGWADSDDEVDEDMKMREAMGRPVLIDRPLVGQLAAGFDDGDDDDGDAAPSERDDEGGDGRRRGTWWIVTCKEHGAREKQQHIAK